MQVDDLCRSSMCNVQLTFMAGGVEFFLLIIVWVRTIYERRLLEWGQHLCFVHLYFSIPILHDLLVTRTTLYPPIKIQAGGVAAYKDFIQCNFVSFFFNHDNLVWSCLRHILSDCIHRHSLPGFMFNSIDNGFCMHTSPSGMSYLTLTLHSKKLHTVCRTFSQAFFIIVPHSYPCLAFVIYNVCTTYNFVLYLKGFTKAQPICEGSSEHSPPICLWDHWTTNIEVFAVARAVIWGYYSWQLRC